MVGFTGSIAAAATTIMSAFSPGNFNPHAAGARGASVDCYGLDEASDRLRRRPGVLRLQVPVRLGGYQSARPVVNGSVILDSDTVRRLQDRR